MKTQLLILAAFFCGYPTLAQLSKASLTTTAKSIYTIKGDYYRNHKSYVFAVNNYSQATKQNPKDVSAMLGMAEVYHKLGKDDLASQWYKKAFATDPDVGVEHILKYILILNTSGNSAEVKRWIAIYTDQIVKSGQHTDSAVFISMLNADGNSGEINPTEPSGQPKIGKLKFKDFDHDIEHPAVSSDGKVVYFAAQSARHTKGFDLYRSEYNGKKWSDPVSLGTSVNSHGNELYPVLHNDSILYFSSNGHSGFGGLDIFKVNLKLKHHHQHIEHLPAPVNSIADDFSLVINSSGTEGYLSSKRAGGTGGNDFYNIYVLPAKKAVSKHEELFIYTSKGEEIKLSGSSKENLKFDFQPGRKYNLVVEYDNYLNGVTTQSNSNAATLNRLNVYTFDIQKSSEAVYDQKNKSKPVQDIHINLGDLVTFQLIPNLLHDAQAEASKIHFQRSDVTISDRETLIFSYVAEGGPTFPEADVLPVADVRELNKLSSALPIASNESSTKSDKVISTSGKASTSARQMEPAKNQVTDLNHPALVEAALVGTAVSEKNIPLLTPAEESPVSNTTKSNDDIQYRVQIAASRAKMSNAALKKIYSGSREIHSFTEAGYYKYYIEQTPNYPDAKRVLKESGVGQAFIVPYQGDTKLTLSEAIASQKSAGK